MSFKVVTIRRKVQIAIAPEPVHPTWWWTTRYGRLDSLRFVLLPKAGGEPLAGVTVLGLDLYLPKWQERVIGLTDLSVAENERRRGYAQTLLLEVSRRLRDEMVNRVEAHVSEANAAALRTFESAGFAQVDAGVVYRKAI
jgi:ribosomal protein S18 acetylase RimI-like enzyme